MGNQAFNLVVSLFEALIGHCTEAFPGQVRPHSSPISNTQGAGLADKRQELSVTIRRSGTPDSPMVTAFVTPTGEGEQPVQAINLHLTSYMNGQRIHRLLDFETTQPQNCEYIQHPASSVPSPPLLCHFSSLRSWSCKLTRCRVGRLHNNQISNGRIYPINRPLTDEKGNRQDPKYLIHLCTRG